MIEEIQGFYVEVGGHRLYLDTAGAGEKAMLLIHTAGQQSLQWRFVLPYFASRGYRVIAPDLPGHGKSLLKDFQPLTTIHSFAEILWQLIQVLKLNRPIILGCSIGGNITLDMALHHGGGLHAGIACQSASRTPTFPHRAIDMGLEDSGIPSYSDQGSLGGLSACGSRALPQRVAEILWTRRMGDPKIYYSDLQAWTTHDIHSGLHKISCPVLVVWGNEDYFVPFHLAEETVRGIPGAQMAVLEGIGHYPHIETPDFNLVVEKFLDTLKSPQGQAGA